MHAIVQLKSHLKRIIIHVFLYVLNRLLVVFHIDPIQPLWYLQDLSGVNCDINSSTRETSKRLVGHHTSIKECATLTGNASGKEKEAYGGRLVNTYGKDQGTEMLHRVIDGEAVINNPTKGVDIEMDGLGEVLIFN